MAYMAPSVSVLTLFHIPLVAVAVPLTATEAARKINARINPYSTAVAALVDRNRLVSIFIASPLPSDIVPENLLLGEEG